MSISYDLNDLLVPGFKANGIVTGLKKDGGRDLALIYSEVPAVADAVFTTNCFKAAPVLLGIERIKPGLVQAVLVNSGNANAATGDEGLRSAKLMSKAAAEELNISDSLIMISSTGVIGVPLPVDRVIRGMRTLVQGLHQRGLSKAEEAIMTTDAFPKTALSKVVIAGKDITIAGLAKGAGMIEPNMATMLSFILTDALIERKLLQKIFRWCADRTFNAITVDGCMSTNDTALIMANGFAGNRVLSRMDREARLFRDALHQVMHALAESIVRDGEGATKVITVTVSGAATKKEAKCLARAVANSNLVKTAFYGGDPNWGRIISAAGSIGANLPIEKVEVALDGITIFRNGQGVLENEESIARIISQAKITVELKLAKGKSSFSLMTSDLSFDYVKINSHYRT